MVSDRETLEIAMQICLLITLSSMHSPGLPPFDQIKPEHFKTAFESVMATHLDEIKAIATSSEAPTFQNTIHALDKAGGEYVKISYLFGNLCSSLTTPALQEVEMLLAPITAGENQLMWSHHAPH